MGSTHLVTRLAPRYDRLQLISNSVHTQIHDLRTENERLRAILWQYERDVTREGLDVTNTPTGTTAVPSIATSVNFAQDVDSGQFAHYGASSFHPFCADSRRGSVRYSSGGGHLATTRAMTLDLLPVHVHTELLDLFFEHVNDFTTFMDPLDFERDRLAHSSWSITFPGVSSSYSPLLHLAILAIASHLSTRPELREEIDDPSTAGLGFMTEALSLLADELLFPPKPTTALALTLLCSALADRGCDSAAWIHCGTAIRMVQHLGLHLVNPEGDNARQSTQTIWSVFLADK